MWITWHLFIFLLLIPFANRIYWSTAHFSKCPKWTKKLIKLLHLNNFAIITICDSRQFYNDHMIYLYSSYSPYFRNPDVKYALESSTVNPNIKAIFIPKIKDNRSTEPKIIIFKDKLCDYQKDNYFYKYDFCKSVLYGFMLMNMRKKYSTYKDAESAVESTLEMEWNKLQKENPNFDNEIYKLCSLKK